MVNNAVTTNYLDSVDKVVREALAEEDNEVHKEDNDCTGFVVLGSCECGRQYAMRIRCGKEWCPSCGNMGSDFHKRKIARWLPKIQEFDTLGYFVFTIPIDIRSKYRSKEALSLLHKKIVNGDKSKGIKGILKENGFEMGLSRWHFFGDRSIGSFHPHLNVLVKGGKLSIYVLNKIRREYARVLGVDIAVVHYQYTKEIGKMYSILSYVTRATFLDREWDNLLADKLFNFRNNRVFGKWSGRKVWKLDNKETGEINDILLLENSICPCCGNVIIWKGGVRSDSWLEANKVFGDVEDKGGGFYEVYGSRKKERV